MSEIGLRPYQLTGGAYSLWFEIKTSVLGPQAAVALEGVLCDGRSELEYGNGVTLAPLDADEKRFIEDAAVRHGVILYPQK